MQISPILTNGRLLRILSLITLAWVNAGCVGQQTFSNTARTGDTIMVALGGSSSHQTSSFVNKSNVQVTVIDSSGASYPVKLRNLFKLYPDPTSRLNYGTTYDASQAPPWLSRYYRTPNQGEWVAIIDLTNPTTGALLPLQSGPATLAVSSPDLKDSVLAFNASDTDGDLQQIAINIIPGTGSPHPFNSYADPSALEALPQIQISFDASKITDTLSTDISTATIIGAIEFTIMANGSIFTNAQFPPMVRGNIEEPRIMTYTNRKVVNGNRAIKVILTEPSLGIVATPDPDNLLNTYSAYLRYSAIKNVKVFVTWAPERISGTISSTNYGDAFQITDYRVLDLDGNILTDGAAEPLVLPVIEPLIE